MESVCGLSIRFMRPTHGARTRFMPRHLLHFGLELYWGYLFNRRSSKHWLIGYSLICLDMLIGTWSLTWDNSATTRVVWDALGWLIRKASGGLPYPKGARAVGSCRYREVLGLIMLRWLVEGFLYRSPQTVAGFLKLVELCKGLVVLPCLVSSV
jgi:hypothetical protein